MSESNLFFSAVIGKYRYPSPKGLVNTEDLVDLTLDQLNQTAKTINGEIQLLEQEDFIGEPNQDSEHLRSRLEIVKQVIAYKKSLKARSEAIREAHAQKQRLLQLIEQKEQNSLSELSVEELRERLAQLI